jgi:N-methylhydantoinase A
MSPIGRRDVWFMPDGPSVTPLYRREHLSAGQVLRGPAIIEQMDTTTLVFPADMVRVDDHLNLVLEVAR